MHAAGAGRREVPRGDAGADAGLDIGAPDTVPTSRVDHGMSDGAVWRERKADDDGADEQAVCSRSPYCV